MKDEYRSIITSKGQLVIPAALRRLLAIQEGTSVVIWEESGRLVLQPVTAAFVRGLRGRVSEKTDKPDSGS